MEKRQEYVENMKAKIDEWNADINKLEAKIKQSSIEAQKDYQEQLANLKAKRDEASARLDELQSASDDAWEDIKEAAENAWTSVESGLKSAFSRFK